MFGKFAKQLVAFAISIILARLLVPEEFGVVGIALVFVALSEVFADVGFTEGLIQKQNVSNIVYSSVFYINIFLSLLLAGITYALAPIIGDFYNSDEITRVLQSLALIPIISSFGRVHVAILIKRIDFKSLSIREIWATLIGGLAGIIAAVKGLGVYSLVWQQLITSLVGTLLLWWRTNWRPSLVIGIKEVKPIFVFSGFIFLDRVVQQVFLRVGTLFIGKVFSLSVLGYYSRADSLKGFVNKYGSSGVGRISFPIFSHLQDDRKKLHSVFFKVISGALVLTVILSGSLFFLAECLIMLLLGEKWLPSVELFQVLVITCITLPFRTILFKLLMGLGLSRLKFTIGTIVNVLTLISFPIGYIYGVYAFVWSYVLVRVVTTIFLWFFVTRRLSLNATRYIFDLVSPLLVFIIFMALYYSEIFNIDSWVYFFPFIIVLYTILLVSRNQGYLILQDQVKKILISDSRTSLSGSRYGE